jgi:uncharacterized protein DUF695
MASWLRRLFGRKKDANDWSLSVGEEKGETVVVRTRTRPPAGMDPNAYPHAVELIWRFDGAATAGMPTPEVHQLLMDCEGLLHVLERSGSGMLGLSITGNGRREWVWYVRDPALFSRQVEDLVSASRRAFPLEVRAGRSSS